MFRPLAIALLLTPLTSCLSVAPPGAFFATEPPGARVVIDGRDSGWVTPCQIALDVEATQEVSLELEGFRPYRIALQPGYRRHVIDWHLGATGGDSTIHLPLFLPPEDIFYPFRTDDGLVPARVFARLRPEDES